MKHFSRGTHAGIHDEGPKGFRMPMTFHQTACGKSVLPSEVAPEAEVDCDVCNEILTWEEIDRNADTQGN